VSLKVAGALVSKVDWATYKFNFEIGCIHDCKYCYAKQMNKRYKWIPKWTQPQLKNPATLRKQITKLHEAPEGTVFFQDIGDAFQNHPQIFSACKYWLSKVLRTKHTILILTKSPLVKQCVGMLQKHENAWVGFTITSLKHIPEWEPNAPPNPERVHAVKFLHDAGLKTFVSIEPWIKNVTNPIEIISALIDYVDWWIIGSHNFARKPLHPEYYNLELPRLVDFMNEHGIRYFVKEELRTLNRNLNYKNVLPRASRLAKP